MSHNIKIENNNIIAYKKPCNCGKVQEVGKMNNK
jgi:hypothetical protein